MVPRPWVTLFLINVGSIFTVYVVFESSSQGEILCLVGGGLSDAWDWTHPLPPPNTCHPGIRTSNWSQRVQACKLKGRACTVPAHMINSHTANLMSLRALRRCRVPQDVLWQAAYLPSETGTLLSSLCPAFHTCLLALQEMQQKTRPESASNIRKPELPHTGTGSEQQRHNHCCPQPTTNRARFPGQLTMRCNEGKENQTQSFPSCSQTAVI